MYKTLHLQILNKKTIAVNYFFQQLRHRSIHCFKIGYGFRMIAEQ